MDTIANKYCRMLDWERLDDTALCKRYNEMNVICLSYSLITTGYTYTFKDNSVLSVNYTNKTFTVV